MNIKEWCIKKKDYILISITIIISCVIYWNYLKGHFAAETYSVVVNGYRNYAINAHLVDGRFFSCLLLMFAELINIPILNFMSVSVFMGIVIATFAVYKLKSIIVKFVPANGFQEIIIWLISYCTIFNCMLIEILYFPETCIMVLSILLYIIAADFFIRKKYICNFFALMLGIFCYQGTIGFFAVCSFLFSIIKNKKIGKELLIDILKIIIIGIISAVLNLLFIKIISKLLHLYQYKVFSFDINNIKENIILIYNNVFYILKNNCGLFPENLLLIFIWIIILFTLYIMSKEKNDRVGLIIIVMLATIVSSFVLFLIQRGSFYTGRVHFCIGTLIGVALLYIYSCSNVRYEKKQEKVLLIILILYCVINCFNTVQIVNEHQKVNELEKEECIKIGKMIEEYEDVNNLEVKKIVPIIIYNQSEKGYFDIIKRRTVVTYNNIRHYWAYVGIIQYYLNNNLQNIEINLESNKIYTEYVEAEDIEYGDIVCIGDTLYCPQYIF